LSTAIAASNLLAMVNLLLIGAGGFFGAISRYGIGQWVTGLSSTANKFPYGTLAVNLVGCLLIGVAFGFISRDAIGRPMQMLLITGFLGGFTTFSTFGLDALKLIHAGSYGTAALYAGISAIVGIAFVAGGYELAK